MDPATRTFDRLRPRLHAIAYRMLGATGEAEEVVQDAWLRWHETAPAGLESEEAWLVTVTTRLAIDRLRAAKVQREHYVGTWLPEPLVEDAPPTPEQILERADSVSTAFLVMLERLAPEARAAFLLREVFDADYAQVAQAIGKSEAACRQIVHRAKEQLREEKPRFTVPPEVHHRLLSEFAQAASRGDFAGLQSLLADDAELIGDGGGKVPSFGRPLVGGKRIAQLYYAVRLRLGEGLRIELAMINGQWGVLRFENGVLESAQSFETDGERILRIHAQRNPEKLARLSQTLAAVRLGDGKSNIPPRNGETP
jgi:RNA polymerase sigma-70 factor (ECF subfamily)